MCWYCKFIWLTLLLDSNCNYSKKKSSVCLTDNNFLLNSVDMFFNKQLVYSCMLTCFCMSSKHSKIYVPQPEIEHRTDNGCYDSYLPNHFGFANTGKLTSCITDTITLIWPQSGFHFCAETFQCSQFVSQLLIYDMLPIGHVNRGGSCSHPRPCLRDM